MRLINNWKRTMPQSPYRFIAAHDGTTLRCGCWLREQPRDSRTVVLLGGRTEFMEKYQDAVSALNHRGMNVVSMDWRGQGLSGRGLRNPRKGYVATYWDYLADLDQLMRDVVSPLCQTPPMFVAHSMGGAIALHYLHGFPGGVERAVLLAPLIRVNLGPGTERLARLLSRWLTRSGLGHLAIPSFKKRHSYLGPFRNNGLTGDPGRFRAIRRMIREDSRLDASLVTYGWLDATFEAIDVFRKNEFAKRITAPVLLALAGGDRVVCNDAIYRLAAHLPQKRVLNVAGARHEILQESADVQAPFWSAFDAFVG
jgi:lysophospholipase